MTVSVRSLGSGSSGNALLIASATGKVLVDCGIGARALGGGLRAANTSLEQLDAVLVTHEHIDHVRAIPSIRKASIPIVCTRGTASAAGLLDRGWEEVRIGRDLRVGGMTVIPVNVAHDAAEPCGYVIQADGYHIVVMTDLGSPPPNAHEVLVDADLIAIEANHDELMLRRGPYPAILKRRVLSDRGHLSNLDCGSLLAGSLRDRRGSTTIWLAHLSTTNNRPNLATATVVSALASAGRVFPVEALARHGQDQVWRPGQVDTTPRQLALGFGG